MLFKDRVCLKYGSFVPIFFCMSGLQELSVLQIFYCCMFYFDAALLLLACLPCVVVRTSVTVLQTGCGRSDFGDAQAER